MRRGISLLMLFALGLVATFLFLKHDSNTPPPSSELISSTNRISPQLAIQLARLEAKERRINDTTWKDEILAQQYGQTFETLWDEINAVSNKLSVAASFPVGELVLPRWGAVQALPHDIEVRVNEGKGSVLSESDWGDFVKESIRKDWQLHQIEIRHSRFTLSDSGNPQTSHFYFSAHLTNPSRSMRAILDGTLLVHWNEKQSNELPQTVRRIDASELTIKTRIGDPPFQLIFSEHITPPENSYSIDPLILYDYDGDGLSEITLAARNLVYRQNQEGQFEPEPLCEFPSGLISTAVVADLNTDGTADFLAETLQGLVLFGGSQGGAFGTAGRLVWPKTPDLKYSMVITCGDIDGDGDLDVFLGQYKVPYRNGQLPTPFYDANDGYPFYLLRNDGHGNLTDITDAVGLSKKRRRRCYSASIVDLDGDNLQDLVIVSDFAGVDFYRNNGKGQFSEITADLIPDPHAFGMGHAFADFNSDGLLDFLMIGMNSPTVERLDHLGLRHPDAIEDPAMRHRMTYGNRLYLNRGDLRYEQTSLSDSIARSGWSWGCGVFDFDNDGFQDVYIANGLESRQSVKEYESEYWLHDAYIGRSNNDSAAYLYFGSKFSRTRGRGHSYGGYEKNRFYLNRRGNSFVEIGHLLGVALEEDSRNVVADDLDADGRIDLLVTSFETWPESKQTLRIYRNELKNSGNWIGFNLNEEGNGRSPVGTKVTLQLEGRAQIRQTVTGDSYRSQHATTAHFGLGNVNRAESVQVAWPNGGILTVHSPAVNRYHSVNTGQPNGNPRTLKLP